MKKRTMLAIASLASGFVVAAVTPSHADVTVGPLNVDKTLSTLVKAVGNDHLTRDDKDKEKEKDG